ncbi:ATP synthase subunit delta [Metamycoplasma hyosynoviae]|uniref:F0F1 ATP synthase subunit delta n=1 Tax=Metamycoplasma hyosynoviae TaxID=29559 RepID=UPI00046163E9|nr:F0F1 ATP synthase subunit delta [Metamycoplasma hyosynoviae]KDE43386.1 ATP synthase subunit delta [Metamycoplasma hyosynoviae]
MLHINEIIYNWSFALYDLANELNQLKKLKAEVIIINSVLHENKKYLKYLNTLWISQEEKFKNIDVAFSKFNKYLVNFIKLIVKANISNYLIVIFKKFLELANQKLNIKYGVIYSTSPLTKLEIEKITKKVCQKLNSEVYLENKIDSNLIAGIKIKIGDYIIENSIDNYLNKFKKFATTK